MQAAEVKHVHESLEAGQPDVDREGDSTVHKMEDTVKECLDSVLLPQIRLVMEKFGSEPRSEPEPIRTERLRTPI